MELEYIKNKYNLDFSNKLPIEIPNIGRDQMADLFNELGFKVGAEIGVEAGLYSEVLFREIPNLKLYCIDSWKAYDGYREYVSQKKIDGFFKSAKKRLAKNNVEFIRKFSMDAVKDFKDESLDFVFIDGNHSFEDVVQDVAYWSKKVRKGGIVSGHDYVRRSKPSTHKVVTAIQGYTYSYNINPWFVLGRQEKRDGEIRDKSRSWMFIK